MKDEKPPDSNEDTATDAHELYERKGPDYFLIIFGIIVLLIPLAFAVIQPSLYPKLSFHLRVITAIGGAIAGAALPGILEVKIPFARGAGALAIFLVIFYINPPKLAEESVSQKNPVVVAEKEEALIKSTTGDTAKVTIDNRDYVRYPAAFISLEKGKIIPLPEEFENATIEADLWVEPRDPEVAVLSSQFEGAIHLGRDTKVAIGEKLTFSEITSVPEVINWTDSLPKKLIRAGTIFLVRSSSNHIYKVSIDEWDQGSRERTDQRGVLGIGGFVQLSFARID